MTGGVPRERPGRRMVLLALFLVGSVLAAAVAARPVLAQTEGGVPPDYVPPEVVLEEDGTPPDFLLDEDAGVVIIDGDGATDCPSFAAALEEGFLGGNRGQAQSVLEQCRRAGFLPSGGSAPASRTTEEALTEGAALAQPLNGPSTPPPPEYVLEGALLTKDGDTGVFCSDLYQYVEGGGTDALARRDLALCYQYGFSPSGVAAETNHPPGTDGAVLPRTGGAALLRVTAGLLLAGAAVVLAARRATGS